MRVSALVATLLAGCNFAADDIASVPDTPSFALDVLPMLEDHGTLCHGERHNRGAPATFRLDVYDDVGAVLGARSKAPAMLAQIDSDQMPPAAQWGDGLGPNAKELLRRWVALGAPP